MPSQIMASCASVSRTVPSAGDGQRSAPRDDLVAEAEALTVPMKKRQRVTTPEQRFCFRAPWAAAASPLTLWRLSVGTSQWDANGPRDIGERQGKSEPRCLARPRLRTRTPGDSAPRPQCRLQREAAAVRVPDLGEPRPSMPGGPSTPDTSDVDGPRSPQPWPPFGHVARGRRDRDCKKFQHIFCRPYPPTPSIEWQTVRPTPRRTGGGRKAA